MKDRDFASGPRLHRGTGCYVILTRLLTRLESILSVTSFPIDLRLAWGTFLVARCAVRETDTGFYANRAGSHACLLI